MVLDELLAQRGPLRRRDAGIEGGQLPERDDLVTERRARVLRSLRVGAHVVLAATAAATTAAAPAAASSTVVALLQSGNLEVLNNVRLVCLMKYTVIHLLVVDVSCVLVWDHAH